MAGAAINIGSIEADLQLNSGNLERGLANGRKAMAALEHEIKQLQADLKAGAIAQADFTARTNEAAAAQAALASKMQAVFASGKAGGALDLINKNAGMLSQSSGRAGMALMQLGNIIDDVQYGFMGVVNNIGPLAFALSGGNMSVAAGAQVAAVAAYQLYKNWNQLEDAMGVGAVRSEAERMEELGKQTKKTADETERLNKYKREQKEIDEILGKLGPDQEAHKKGLMDSLAALGDFKNTGGEKIAASLAGVLRSEGGGAQMTEKEKEEIDELKRKAAKGEDVQIRTQEGMEDWRKEHPFSLKAPSAPASEVLEKRMKPISERLDKEDNDRAKKMLAEAASDPDTLKAIIAKVRRNPKAFPAGLASDLEAELPENRKAQKEANEQADIEHQGRENNRKFIRDQDKERDRKAADIAKDVMGGASGAAALGGASSTELATKALGNANIGVDEAEELLPKVAKAIDDAVSEKIRAGMLNGQTEQQARRAAATEANDRFGDDSAKQARGMADGIDDVATRSVLGARMGGGTMDDVKAEISRVLEMADKADGVMDLTADQLKAATEKIVSDANKGVNEDIQKAMQNPEQERTEKLKKSEQFNASSLAQKIQAGVGGGDEPQKKQVTLQEQMVKHLAAIAAAKGGNPFDGGMKR